MPSPPRPIKRLLVANRGEIAVRILHAARELATPVETFALYTENDRSHCDLGRPHHALLLPSPASYTDIPLLVKLAQEHAIDTVHPGYGFLSESAEFARRMWDEAGVKVVGPGWEALAQMGDKLQAKALAVRCGVPVLQTMEDPTGNIDRIRTFAEQVGYPVMIKAVDGGGGRGIRLVRQASDLQNAVDRAKGESPSRTVFVEKAAVGGFHHIEIQIIGDGSGQVTHLWERDCSVQRRFQKIVECAPAVTHDRKLIEKVIDSAMRMASESRYLSLGTFEFLVNEHLQQFYFLEINPRLQVEHTVTECISGVDLVQTQLLLAQGYSLQQLRELGVMKGATQIPESFSIQLRLCAEDPAANFALSIGKVTEFIVPSGNGIRVDTNISSVSPVLVGSDFDNLLAKIIVTAASWEAAVRKARRVLVDTRISGVKTNIDLLRGILDHKHFLLGRTDTQWLEGNLESLVRAGSAISHDIGGKAESAIASITTVSSASPSSSNLLFRKGDAWSITLEPLDQNHRSSQKTQQHQTQHLPHHLLLRRILRNEFPSSFSAEIEYTMPSSSTEPGSRTSPTAYKLHLVETNTSASALTSAAHRRGDPLNPNHILLPLSGKLVEVLVSEGDEIAENDVLAFVKQMKMELEVRSPRAGRVKWALAVDDDDGGEDVAEGVLLVELEDRRNKKDGASAGDSAGNKERINFLGKL